MTERGGGTGKAGPWVEEDSLVDGLAQAAFLTMGVLSRVSAKHELSMTLLRVLGILRNRRLRMSALADHLGLEKSTITGLVSRAEQRGLIERAPSLDDRRSVDALLTDSGAALAAVMLTEVRASLQTVTDGLTRAEQARLAQLLDRMLERR